MSEEALSGFQGALVDLSATELLGRLNKAGLTIEGAGTEASNDPPYVLPKRADSRGSSFVSSSCKRRLPQS